MNEVPTLDRVQRAARDADVMLSWHRWLTDNDDLQEYGDLREHIARKVRINKEHVRMHAATSRR